MIDRLDWDSDFFEMNIGKYEASSISKEDITALLSKKRCDGYDLLYVFADKLAEPDCDEWIKSHGGMLVDRKVIYEKQIPANVTLHPNISEYSGTMTAELKSLALESGHSSRFKIDPRLNHKFDEFYTLWMQKSVDKILADNIFVFKEKEQIWGVVTIKIKNGVGQIGLIAVDERARGRGIGRALIAACDHWLVSKGISRHQVVTQLQNMDACTVYEKCGFSKLLVQIIYHL
jgi:dTDP-4-amino-4,6-dideoxy-D-galactose acyltransferase